MADLLKLTGDSPFGEIDAESDARLAEYFVSTPAFRTLISRQRYVAVGRKGAGKTAIYRELRDRTGSDYAAVGLSFAGYPWGAHSTLGSSVASANERFLDSWRFMILIELAKLAIRDQASRDPEVSRAIREFIEKTWGQIEFTPGEFFGKAEYELVGEFRPSLHGASLGSVGRKTVERNRLGETLNATLAWLETALSRVLVPTHDYFVLFDDLDKGYDKPDADYQQRIVGLLLAAYRTAVWANDAGLRARAIVFLRSDIFELLGFSDKNKIYDNAVINVRWSEAEKGPESLRNLMAERIQNRADIKADEDAWDAIFDPDEVMRGTTSKYRHMVRRTYLRPRDIIKFSNLAVVEARERISQGSTARLRVGNKDIGRARVPYSAYLVRELDDEIKPEWPDWRGYLELLRRVGRVDITRAKLKEQYDALKDPTLDFDEVVSRFYKYSILGFQRAGGSSGGSVYLFAYSSPEVELDPAASAFKAHLGLIESLGLKEGKGSDI